MRVREIAAGIWACLAGHAGWGWSNAALVVGEDGSGLLFDCGMTARQGETLVAESGRHAPGGLEYAVYSHSNPDHTWGSVALPGPTQVISSVATARELPYETSPAQLREVLAADAPAESGIAYLQQHFSVFDLEGTPDAGPRVPDRTFEHRLPLDVGGRQVELVRVGPAHTAGDVIAHVPDAGVVFAGDVLFFTDHPISWGVPLSGWLRALELLLETGATVFVPGHGPVAGRREVRELLDYLGQLDTFAAESANAGVPLREAALRMPTDLRWQQPERAISVLLAGYRAAGLSEQLPQLGMTALIAAHSHALAGITPANP